MIQKRYSKRYSALTGCTVQKKKEKKEKKDDTLFILIDVMNDLHYNENKR